VLRKFFEAYLSRSLTKEELDKLVAETHEETQKVDGNIEYCGDTCRIALAALSAHQKYFTKNPHTIKELLLRRMYLANSLFDPQQQNTLSLKLLNEPSPAVIIDRKRKRFMTRRDVAALLRLQVLAKTKKLDRKLEIKPIHIKTAINAIKTKLSKDSLSRLSVLTGFSSEMYIGIAREWDNLSEKDKKITLAYLSSPVADSFPARLYEKFLNLSREESLLIHHTQEMDSIKYVNMRLYQAWGLHNSINSFSHGLNKMHPTTPCTGSYCP
jgi:plasmid maintenance system antidote protein VapI